MVLITIHNPIVLKHQGRYADVIGISKTYKKELVFQLLNEDKPCCLSSLKNVEAATIDD